MANVQESAVAPAFVCLKQRVKNSHQERLSDGGTVKVKHPHEIIHELSFLVVVAMIGKEIERDRHGRVEIDNVLLPLFRDIPHHNFNEVGGRVDNTDPLAPDEVSKNHPLKERTFARAGISADIGRKRTVPLFDADQKASPI